MGKSKPCDIKKDSSPKQTAAFLFLSKLYAEMRIILAKNVPNSFFALFIESNLLTLN